MAEAAAVSKQEEVTAPPAPPAPRAEINVMPQGSQGGLIPTTFEALWRMSEVMAASGMMPKGLEEPAAVFVAVQMGLEVGLSPMQAVQNIAVINGRPSIWGDAALALVQSSGLLLDFEETFEGEWGKDSFKAVCRALRKGRSSEVMREFSVADAKQAGLWTKAGPWKDYPKRMLQMRARSWALRDAFPDSLKGLRIAEEQQDVIDVTPEEATGKNVQSLKKRLDRAKKTTTNQPPHGQAGARKPAAGEEQASPAMPGDMEPPLLERIQVRLEELDMYDDLTLVMDAIERNLDGKGRKKLLDEISQQPACLIGVEKVLKT